MSATALPFTRIPPSKFYPAPTPSTPPTPLHSTLHNLRARTFNSNPFKPWLLFPTQQQALNHMKSNPVTGLILFGMEFDVHKPGKRKFLLTTVEEFYERYLTKIRKEERVFYEVIQEDARCRLYFDLEFDKTVKGNGELDFEGGVEQLVELVFEKLEQVFHIYTPPSLWLSKVVQLDASTDAKFSRHLIFDLDPWWFGNNRHMGEFVKMICAYVKGRLRYLEGADCLQEEEEKKEELKRLQKLVVWNEDGEKGLLVDESVYTRNRQFRIWGSTKIGKNRPLKIVRPQQQRALKTLESDTKENEVGESNQTNSQTEKQQEEEEEEETIDLPTFKRTLVASYTPVPTSQQDLQRLLWYSPPTSSFLSETTHPSTRKWTSTRTLPHPLPPPPAPALQTSPLPPNIFHLLQTHISKNTPAPHSLSLSPTPKIYPASPHLAFFSILGNRFCEGVGREHKSNGTFVVVDVRNLLEGGGGGAGEKG
ncbi:hypothetical protein HDV05_004491 [Chytridiales sp. JEL 0842]|nr:hypothetical protein HDV05_004491 [Chytridiales sp. JEL 0842]